MSIVITGATGHLGRLVIDELLARVPAGRLVAVVRDTARAAVLADQGVELRVADFDQPETLADAFRPDDVVLLISAPVLGRREAQHTAVIKAAKQAGVARLAYTGVLGGPAADFTLADEHKATEQAILDSGLTHTFLRNGWYTENYTAQIPVQLRYGVRRQRGRRPDRGRRARRLRRRGRGGAHQRGSREQGVRTQRRHGVDLSEYAAELSRQTGTNVAYADLPPAAYKGVLTGAGVPEAVAGVLVDVDVRGIARGLLAGGSGDLSRLIGRPTTPLADSIATALKG